jgi:GntR family transcriptional regulator
VAEGLVDRVPGRGTFVVDRQPKYLRQFGSVEDLMGLSLDTSMQIVRPLARGVNIEAAGRLQLDSDVVHSVSFVRTHQGLPFCWTTVSLPPAVAEVLHGIPELSTVGATSALTVIGLLDGRLADPIAEAEQSISAVCAEDVHAEVLQCAARTALLRIDRRYLSAGGVPVELAVSYFRPDQYSYRTSLRRTWR